MPLPTLRFLQIWAKLLAVSDTHVRVPDVPAFQKLVQHRYLDKEITSKLTRALLLGKWPEKNTINKLGKMPSSKNFFNYKNALAKPLQHVICPVAPIQPLYGLCLMCTASLSANL